MELRKARKGKERGAGRLAAGAAAAVLSLTAATQAHAVTGGGGVALRPGFDFWTETPQQAEVDTHGFSLAIGGRGYFQPSPLVRIGAEGYHGLTTTGTLVWGGLLAELGAPVSDWLGLGFGATIGAWGAGYAQERGLDARGIYVEPGVTATLNMGAFAIETRASYLIPFALQVGNAQTGGEQARPQFGYGAITIGLLFGDFGKPATEMGMGY